MSSEEPRKPARSQRFLVNVLWIWLGFAVSIVAGLVLPPMVTRNLGDAGYGVWSLIFSFIGYYGLVDFGLRSAVVRFAAEYHATNDQEKINRLFSTMMLHFSWLMGAMMVVTVVLSRFSDRFIHDTGQYQSQIPWLVIIVGVSTAFGLPGTVLSGIVEGYQRFDLAGRVSLISFGSRYAGVMVLLTMGYGLVEMALCVLASVLLYVALYFWYLRRLQPRPRFGFRYVDRSVLREAFRYGVHTFSAGLASRVLEQGSPVMIGYYMPAMFVGYFNFPVRLLAYAAEPLSRVGNAVQPQVTELIAKGEMGAVAQLGIYVNRYCYALFAPFGIFLLVYGGDLLGVWMGRTFQVESTPLLAPMMVATGIATAGQFSSSSMLFGLSKHQRFAYGQLVEAALLVVLSALAIPAYGIFGAACVSAGLMLLVRGIYTPWLVCQYLDYPLARYMKSIYLAPTLTAIPVYLVLLWLKGVLPGSGWAELVAAGAVASVLFFGAAYFTSLQPEHRAIVKRMAGRFLPGPRE